VNALEGAECVYVDGGNTFWLLQCIRRSGGAVQVAAG
jgi:peptidase E